MLQVAYVHMMWYYRNGDLSSKPKGARAFAKGRAVILKEAMI